MTDVPQNPSQPRQQRWDGGQPPEQILGAVVHGPMLLARSPGIAAGLRCAFGYPEGVNLLVTLRAEGVQAEAAGRGFDADRLGARASWSDLHLVVSVDDHTGPVLPTRSTASGGGEHYLAEYEYWVPAVPTDGLITVSTAWPESGLAEHTTRLHLDLADVDDGLLELL